MEMLMGCFGVLVGFGEAIIVKALLRQRAIVSDSVMLWWQRAGLLAAITGSAFVLAYLKIGWNFLLIHALVFTCFLIIIALIDLWHGLIMQPVIMTMLFVGLMLTIIYLNALSLNIIDALIGCGVGGGSLFLLAWGSGKMGYGDAWFAAALGLWLGWQSLLALLWLAFVGGGFIGLGLLLTGIKQRQEAIPFGPFLAIAAFVVYFYYSEMIMLLGQLFL